MYILSLLFALRYICVLLHLSPIFLGPFLFQFFLQPFFVELVSYITFLALFLEIRSHLKNVKIVQKRSKEATFEFCSMNAKFCKYHSDHCSVIYSEQRACFYEPLCPSVLEMPVIFLSQLAP